MRYLPNSNHDRELMLRAVGVRSIDELFAPIPEQFRLKRDLKIPPQKSESEIVEWFRARAAETAPCSVAMSATCAAIWRRLILNTESECNGFQAVNKYRATSECVRGRCFLAATSRY